MRKRVMLDKRVGETPLTAIERWKAQHTKYRDVPASYAGRLDPMASGKLLVLLGDECKRQMEYTKLDKVYDIEVLLDVGSDTGDILGIVHSVSSVTVPSRSIIHDVIRTELGTHTRPYPVYSSKTVNGKPLFLYALEGTLDTITIPTHEETISSITHQGTQTVSSAVLSERIHALLEQAPTSDEPSKAFGADFRIAKVTESWERTLAEDRPYCVLRFTVSCGSGTYMRSLAGRIGEALGTEALALSIRRTKIRGLPGI